VEQRQLPPVDVRNDGAAQTGTDTSEKSKEGTKQTKAPPGTLMPRFVPLTRDPGDRGVGDAGTARRLLSTDQLRLRQAVSHTIRGVTVTLAVTI
jgi:hypothetical protein